MSDGTCQENAGFLFKHPCDRRVFAYCKDCQKGICQRHSHEFEGDALCTTCAKKAIKHAGKARYGRYEDDPYFYSLYHYENYGRYDRGMWGHDYYADHDPADLSEADAESFATEGDEGWEDDMGGS